MSQPTTTNVHRRSSTDSILSSALSSNHSDDDLIVTDIRAQAPTPVPPLQPVPRTPNRVRFALDETPGDEEERGATGDRWAADDDDDHLGSDDEGEGDDSRGNRAPLLMTPGRTEFELEMSLEESRPKSGMKMAFMNMANSIIGAGIIGELLPLLCGISRGGGTDGRSAGQPYAFRQAGLGMGVFLLVGLTIMVLRAVALLQGSLCGLISVAIGRLDYKPNSNKLEAQWC